MTDHLKLAVQEALRLNGNPKLTYSQAKALILYISELMDKDIWDKITLLSPMKPPINRVK